MSRAYVVLAMLMIALAACVFFASAAQVNDIRGDFCDYLTVHDRSARELPQVQARQEAEANDGELITRLHCG